MATTMANSMVYYIYGQQIGLYLNPLSILNVGTRLFPIGSNI